MSDLTNKGTATKHARASACLCVSLLMRRLLTPVLCVAGLLPFPALRLTRVWSVLNCNKASGRTLIKGLSIRLSCLMVASVGPSIRLTNDGQAIQLHCHSMPFPLCPPALPLCFLSQPVQVPSNGSRLRPISCIASDCIGRGLLYYSVSTLTRILAVPLD